jgi:multiple antibiotic resistance protein
MPFGFVDILTVLLVTVGPLKALIVFGTLTATAEPEFRRRVADRTVTIAAIVTLVFAVVGEVFLQIFHISLPALKIAGGIILLLFALGMAMGGGHDDEGEGEGGKPPKALSLDIAVFPLAMPMMATPQGLVAITVIVAAQPSVLGLLVVIVAILAVMALNLLCLHSADRIIKAIGPSALQVIAKVAGLLLTALAVQLMILGLRDLGVIGPEAAGAAH